MIHHTRLIILNTTKTGERSLVLHALSPDWGRRSFITSVPRGGGMALFQPLSVLDAEVVENPKSELWRVHALSARHPLAGIRTSPAKNAISLFMAEVLWRTVHEGAFEEGLFDWCERSILTLDALEGDYANYHLRFLLEFAGALGFSPSLEDLMPFARPPQRRRPQRDCGAPAPLHRLPRRNPHRGALAAGAEGIVQIKALIDYQLVAKQLRVILPGVVL